MGSKILGSSPTTGFAVVIDGDTLRFALDSGLKTLFLNLATQCETVVCCRVSVSLESIWEASGSSRTDTLPPSQFSPPRRLRPSDLYVGPDCL